MSQPKLVAEVVQKPDSSVDPELAQPKDWEKGICDCSHWLSGGCVAYFFCTPCSMLCCLPHSFAAMARKINWNGFSKTMAGSYDTNRKSFMRIVIALVLMLVINVAFQATVISSITYNNAQYAKEYEQGVKNCQKQFQDAYKIQECTRNLPTQTYTSVTPAFLLIFIIEFVIACIGVFAEIYMLLLRYHMRKKRNIKPCCFTSCGDVGGALEDAICLATCFSCSVSQMHEEMNVDVAYCCNGEDPGFTDANIIA